MDHSNETSLVWLWQYLRIVPLIFLHSCEVLSFLWPALIRKLVFIWFVLFCPQAVFRRRPQLGRLYTHRFTRTGESLWSVRLLLSYRQSLCSGRQGWSHRWSGQYLYTRGGGGGPRHSVLRILTVGDDRMWAKIKTQKTPWTKKLTPNKSHGEFPILVLYLVTLFAELRDRNTRALSRIFGFFNTPKVPP